MDSCSLPCLAISLMVIKEARCFVTIIVIDYTVAPKYVVSYI